jgi:hypothetical protein
MSSRLVGPGISHVAETAYQPNLASALDGGAKEECVYFEYGRHKISAGINVSSIEYLIPDYMKTATEEQKATFIGMLRKKYPEATKAIGPLRIFACRGATFLWRRSRSCCCIKEQAWGYRTRRAGPCSRR